MGPTSITSSCAGPISTLNSFRFVTDVYSQRINEAID